MKLQFIYELAQKSKLELFKTDQNQNEPTK